MPRFFIHVLSSVVLVATILDVESTALAQQSQAKQQGGQVLDIEKIIGRILIELKNSGILNGQQQMGSAQRSNYGGMVPFGTCYPNGCCANYPVFMPPCPGPKVAAPSANKPPQTQAVPAQRHRSAGQISVATYRPVVAAVSLQGLSEGERRLFAQEALDEGLKHYRQGDRNIALEYFTEATELTPDAATAWAYRGITSLDQNDNSVAKECAARVREIGNANPQARTQLYRALSPMQGQSRLAFEQLVPRSTSSDGNSDRVVRRPR